MLHSSTCFKRQCFQWVHPHVAGVSLFGSDHTSMMKILTTGLSLSLSLSLSISLSSKPVQVKACPNTPAVCHQSVWDLQATVGGAERGGHTENLTWLSLVHSLCYSISIAYMRYMTGCLVWLPYLSHGYHYHSQYLHDIMKKRSSLL